MMEIYDETHIKSHLSKVALTQQPDAHKELMERNFDVWRRDARTWAPSQPRKWPHDAQWEPTFESLYIYTLRASKQCFPRLRLERAAVPGGTFLCLWDITAWFMKQPANYLTIKWVGCVTYVRHRGDRTFLTRRDVWEVLYELSAVQTRVSAPDWMIKLLGQDTWHWASIPLSLSVFHSHSLFGCDMEALDLTH